MSVHIFISVMKALNLPRSQSLNCVEGFLIKKIFVARDLNEGPWCSVSLVVFFRPFHYPNVCKQTAKFKRAPGTPHEEFLPRISSFAPPFV